VNLNEVIIREMMLLLHSEATPYAILVRTELVADIPEVIGDHVELPQVLMNLMMNRIDAMKDVDGARANGRPHDVKPHFFGPSIDKEAC
jgi:C4-dicarboxylate-specific signal transduction histidine kinase